MDNFSWSVPIWITLLCLLLVFIFTVLVAWRTKDLQAGFRLFLMLSAFIILVIFSTSLIMKFISSFYIEILFALSSGISFVFICVTGILYWINAQKAGKLIKNSTDDMTQLNTIGGVAFLGIAIIGFLAIGYRFSSAAILFPMLFAGRLLGNIFLSFQIREHGFVSQGRYIKSESITSMCWVNLKNKDEVEYKVKNSVQSQRLKIPWKFIVPVDNYINANFPRT